MAPYLGLVLLRHSLMDYHQLDCLSHTSYSCPVAPFSDPISLSLPLLFSYYKVYNTTGQVPAARCRLQPQSHCIYIRHLCPYPLPPQSHRCHLPIAFKTYQTRLPPTTAIGDNINSPDLQESNDIRTEYSHPSSLLENGARLNPHKHHSLSHGFQHTSLRRRSLVPNP
jgi:hypothetical protein